MIKNACYTEGYKYVEVWGFSIIPVGKDKKPLLASWKEYQTRKPTIAELDQWFSKWPNANIGIVTGAISGITVVDVDTHKGGSASIFPKTFTVKTGNGGIQLYYAYEKGLTVSANAYKHLPHVDIRNDGGFVVAPPSVTSYKDKDNVLRGGPYTIIEGNGGLFAPFPSHLFPKTKKKHKLTDLIGIKSGSRNSSITSIIGTLLHSLDENKFLTDGWEAVMAINKTYTPPLPIEELQTTFHSIVEKERQRRAEVGQPQPSPIQITPDERIEILLRKNGNGVPYKDMSNALLVLSQHPKTSGKIRYNEFRHEIEYNGRPLEDSDLLQLVYLMQSDAGLPNISKDTVQSAIQHYAHENRYDEAIDWLKALTWDKKPRIATWLIEALGVPDDEHGYHRGIGAQWFKGLVSRLVYPGCVFDHVLVVVGPQGVGKTSLFRILGGDWYKSFTGSVENKDFYLQLRGAAILDLDEGVALYRSESIKMKSIITQVADEYRAPYDRMTKKYPRRFAFSMSTNDSEPFRDVTGNRRYWPVEISEKVNFKWLEENRDQLYAEAYHMLINKLEFPIVPEEYARDEQENYLPNDEWEDLISDYVQKSYLYCVGSIDYSITIREIYTEAIGAEHIERLERKHEIRIGNVLRKLGLKRQRKMIEGERKYRYVLTNAKIKELQANPLTNVDKKQFEENKRIKDNEEF